jgi:hypothetical protein
MLTTIADRMDEVGFELLEDQKLTLTFYRNKKC